MDSNLTLADQRQFLVSVAYAAAVGPLQKFSVPQIEYPLVGSSKKGSHVYFLLQVFWVILLFDINIVLMLHGDLMTQ